MKKKLTLNFKYIILILIQTSFNLIGTAIIKSKVSEVEFHSFLEFVKLIFSFKVVFGITLIGLGFVTMIFILKTIDFSVLIPIASGISFILSTFIGVYYFKEKFGPSLFIGLLFILIGIYIILKNTNV